MSRLRGIATRKGQGRDGDWAHGLGERPGGLAE